MKLYRPMNDRLLNTPGKVLSGETTGGRFHLRTSPAKQRVAVTGRKEQEGSEGAAARPTQNDQHKARKPMEKS